MLFFITSCFLLTSLGCVIGHSHEPKLVYEWITLDLHWPNASLREEYIKSKKFAPENNTINGIKVYKNNIYLTLPSFKDGAPVTLVKVIKKENDQSPSLQPYPSWEMHKKDDCNTLQLVQSMEIDPNAGYMWVLDTAFVPRRNIQVADRCPAKLIIYDIDGDREVHRHVFPESLLGPGMYYLNDIVLDYIDGKASHAYISDTLGKRLFVYDHRKNESYYFEHSDSMYPEQGRLTVTISGETQDVRSLGINGIAMSYDFRYVYYSSVAGVSVYQVPTEVLRSNRNKNIASYIRKVGEKAVQGDAMFYGQDNMYYTTLGQHAVYKWEVKHDAEHSGSYGNVKFESKTEVAKDMRIQWADSLSIDENGYLWFTSNNLHTFFGNSSSVGTPNFFVWKIKINEKSYLANALTTSVGGTEKSTLSIFLLCCAILYSIVSIYF